MSTDCENLLKRFLVLNPVKRSALEQIMQDRWMNIGFEDDNMRPYNGQPSSAEPIDPKRIGKNETFLSVDELFDRIEI